IPEAQTVRQTAEEERVAEVLKGFQITVSTAYNLTQPDADVAGSSATVDSEGGFGFAAMLKTDLRQDLQLEIGATLNKRKFEARSGESLVEQEVSTLHFPVLARMPAGRYFSVGAGPFLGIRVG